MRGRRPQGTRVAVDCVLPFAGGSLSQLVDAAQEHSTPHSPLQEEELAT